MVCMPKSPFYFVFMAVMQSACYTTSCHVQFVHFIETLKLKKTASVYMQNKLLLSL